MIKKELVFDLHVYKSQENLKMNFKVLLAGLFVAGLVTGCSKCSSNPSENTDATGTEATAPMEAGSVDGTTTTTTDGTTTTTTTDGTTTTTAPADGSAMGTTGTTPDASGTPAPTDASTPGTPETGSATGH